jgi:hypothetical protein
VAGAAGVAVGCEEVGGVGVQLAPHPTVLNPDALYPRRTRSEALVQRAVPNESDRT